MSVGIIKYNAGNTKSVVNALGRLGVEPIITDDPELLRACDKVILPGVGEASTAMSYLRERNLHSLICSLKQPILGVCLGLQIMCQSSEENNTECLGIFNSVVKKFPPKDKVPHVGWNSISELKSPLFNTLSDKSYCYFVHSYYAEICEETIATCQYITSFSAALNKDNFYATQFHPEKSSDVGSKILENFLSIDKEISC